MVELIYDIIRRLKQDFVCGELFIVWRVEAMMDGNALLGRIRVLAEHEDTRVVPIRFIILNLNLVCNDCNE